MYIGKFVTSFFQHNDRSLKAKAPLKEPDLMNYILTGGNSPVCSLILGGKHQEGICCKRPTVVVPAASTRLNSSQGSPSSSWMKSLSTRHTSDPPCPIKTFPPTRTPFVERASVTLSMCEAACRTNLARLVHA